MASLEPASQPGLQALEHYQLPPDYSAGAPFWQQGLWFCLGSPLLANHSLPGSAWRICLLRSFGAQIGYGCRIKPGLRVKYPWRLQVGNYCWLGEEVWIDNLAPVQLGDRVCLSQGAYLCTGNHNRRSPSFDLLLGPIQIESEAWICAKAILAPSTHVSQGAIVGLGTVASGFIPPRAIVQGNPAAIVAYR